VKRTTKHGAQQGGAAAPAAPAAQPAP
jgi:hypothetical protein